jgi:DNA polymerase-1
MTPIIIDSNALCHKARHTLGELNNETMRVGVIFGFFIQILKMAKNHNTDQFIFTWDSKKSHRLKLFPAYKEKRRTGADKTPEEKEEDSFAYAQFDQLYEKYLPAIGFKNNFKADGFEGDDIIASVVDNNPDVNFLISSGDEDMYQCLCEGVDIIKEKGVLSVKKFIKEYGIHPNRWAEVKSIAGCTSDEIPGIKGVGEKTAIKFIKGELTPNTKGYQNIMSPEGKRLRALYAKLVTLPFEGCPDFIYTPDTKLSLDAFMDMCKELNFQYFLKKDTLNQWKQHLNLR